MLSNCDILSATRDESYPSYIALFSGRSMNNGTSKSIVDGNFLSVSKANLSRMILAGIVSYRKTDLLVIVTSGQAHLAAYVKDVNLDSSTVTLGFLNRNKKLYPDFTMPFNEVSSIHLITEVCSNSKDTDHRTIEGEPCHHPGKNYNK